MAVRLLQFPKGLAFDLANTSGHTNAISTLLERQRIGSVQLSFATSDQVTQTSCHHSTRQRAD